MQPFLGGLTVINRLHPITFSWKDGGAPDIGLGAEDVARVEPLFTFKNEQGQIEGVKYAQLNVLLINAVKEQQQQIEQQQKLNARQESQLRQQQREINTLKLLVIGGRAALRHRHGKRHD